MVSHRRKDPTNFFVNDIILPSQFRDMRINRYTRQPEKHLVFAIFEDAVYCLITYQNARRPSLRTLYEDAREWFTTTNEEDMRWTFSCKNVCDILGYTHDVMLHRLKPYLHVPTNNKVIALPLPDIMPLVNEHTSEKTLMYEKGKKQ